MKTEEICGYGACWAETREELRAEQMRKAEEAQARLREAQEQILKAAEAGDRWWLRPLLYLLSLNRDTRPSYLERHNLVNRWQPIVGMTEGQVVGCALNVVRILD